ncbi:HutD family protein [Leisingera daeponensis]|uniref:HutD/Ves family protein n=1 Tax=Leisingera daeponensis TaxID=405746 RepID=UPI001C94BA90|nr:HutD family protein [Leisingera daeponensis]MBY6056974.1 HutD family protein [Leisingera daeponensis]
MRFSALAARPVPWKNGGGLTRELASETKGGGTVWRLSLAEISRNGPFSAFPGLARIHCIVDGAGHTLSNDCTRLEARLLELLEFDGGLQLECRLRDGPCKAFNVIYDPARVAASASVLGEGAVPVFGGRQALFVISGSLEIKGTGRLGAGEGIVTASAATGAVSSGSAVVQVQLAPV